MRAENAGERIPAGAALASTVSPIHKALESVPKPAEVYTQSYVCAAFGHQRGWALRDFSRPLSWEKAAIAFETALELGRNKAQAPPPWPVQTQS